MMPRALPNIIRPKIPLRHRDCWEWFLDNWISNFVNYRMLYSRLPPDGFLILPIPAPHLPLFVTIEIYNHLTSGSLRTLNPALRGTNTSPNPRIPSVLDPPGSHLTHLAYATTLARAGTAERGGGLIR